MDNTIEKPGKSVFLVLSRRRYVAVVALAFGVLVSIAIALFIKPYYESSAHILLVNDQQGRDPSTEGLDLPQIATSTTVLDKVRAQLHLDMTIAKLRRNVTVRVAPKSSILTISAKDHNAQISVKITNAVADTFTSFYSSVANGRYASVVSQLRHDLLTRRERILSLESRLQKAASNSSYVGSQTSLDNTASALNELVTQRTFAYASLVSDRAQLESTHSQPGQLSKIIRHETLANDQKYRDLEINVARDAANLAVHKAMYTEHFPGLAGEVAKVDSETKSLDQSASSAINGPTAYSPSLAGQIVAEQKAASTVEGDEARVKALDFQIASTRNELSDIPSSGMNVGSLRALRDTEESQYAALALRLSNAEANSAEANSLGSVVVIDRAERADPSLLGTNFLLLLCLLVAIGLAVVAAYAAESLNPRFISASDAEAFYRRPVLGSITSS